MNRRRLRLASPLALARVALVVFVLAWLFGPHGLRSTVPIWLVFAIALGLELQFFVGGLRAAVPARRPDRGPQDVDRERYGYPEDAEEAEDAEKAEDAEEAEDDEDEPPLEDWAASEDDDWHEAAAGSRLPVRRLLVGLAVIGALVLVLRVVDERTGWDSLDGDARAAAATRFSDEASRIAGKPVTVRCDESGRYVGAVQHSDGAAVVGGELAYLTPERCLDLYRLAFEGEVGSARTARAVAVLAHEAWHLRGVRDEGTTECYALQTGVELGRRLGLSEETARRLMRQQLAENSLRGAGSVEYVVPPECRDGGRLDLNPGLARFP